MTFAELRVGLRVEVSIPKGGEPGMQWVLARVVGWSAGRTRVHVDIEGCDSGLALTASDVKERVREIVWSRAKGPVTP